MSRQLKEISPEIENMVKRQCTYNPDTGVVTRTTHKGTSNGAVNNGYLNLLFTYKGKSSNILVHRIAWFLYYKYWPLQVDHINRDKTDNRICNLRDVNSVVNNKNRGMFSNNTSGHKGVSKNNDVRWQAQIHRKGKAIFLCSSKNKEESAYVYEHVHKYIMDAELNGRELTKADIQLYGKSVRRTYRSD